MSDPPPGDARARLGPRPGLRRELGTFSAVLLVVGGVIGSGIFFTPAETARALPSAPWVLGVWALGGLVSLAGALTYAELGAMMPEAGGGYVYVREAFGPLAAFLLGWMNWLMISSGAIAAVAMSFAGYLSRFVDLGAVGGPIGAAAMTIVVLTATNYFGVRPGTVMANVFTLAKLTALGMLIVFGLVFGLVFAHGVAPVALSAEAARAVAPPSLTAGFAAAFVAVLFTVGGWQQTNMVAGEIRDPERTLPRALAIGIGVVIAVYLGANMVYLRALGRDGLAASTAVASDTAHRLVGPWGATAMTVAAMLSIFGFVNVAMLTNARVLFAMGADGAFVPQAGRAHLRYGSPHVALVMLGAWSLVLLFATNGGIGKLLSGVVFADSAFFGLAAASVFALRAKRPDAIRPFRVPGYPWVPAFFVLCATLGVLSAYVSAFKMSLFGTAMLGAGVLVHARLAWRRGR